MAYSFYMDEYLWGFGEGFVLQIDGDFMIFKCISQNSLISITDHRLIYFVFVLYSFKKEVTKKLNKV